MHVCVCVCLRVHIYVCDDLCACVRVAIVVRVHALPCTFTVPSDVCGVCMHVCTCVRAGVCVSGVCEFGWDVSVSNGCVFLRGEGILSAHLGMGGGKNWEWGGERG